MKIKTSELTGAALDWAVAKCKGYVGADNKQTYDALLLEINKETYHPSTDWSQAGPIIAKENISLAQRSNEPCRAYIYLDLCEYAHVMFAPEHQPLIAAMRCFVASKLGDEVEVPGELTC